MKIVDKLKLILYIKERPSKIALTFSIGLFIGMSPLLGLHTVLALAIAVVFRLNKLVILLGTYVTNPWTLVPIYTFSTILGARLLKKSIKIDINWNHLTFTDLLHQSGNILLPFITGTFIVGALCSVLSYIIIYVILRNWQQRRDSPKIY